jgi:sphinganine-1-phosphate aldolase
MRTIQTLPQSGFSASELEEVLLKCKSGDVRWDQGKIFGFVYHPGSFYAKVAERYLQAFLYESTLNPATFPSLRRFEREIVQMASGLVHGDRQVSGSVTSGGTESIILALKVARELAREKGNMEEPFEVILPETIHPAFLKGCDLLSLLPVLVPVGIGKRADPEAMEASISPRTILIACSAPCFPYGVVDPVEELGEVARKHRMFMHVDACLGGFMLPFLESSGNAVPRFDFRVRGVTSLSMDAHKYGYAPKGTSVLLFRERAMRRKQFFIHTEWPGGIFASTTLLGTRSGGPLAGCWAIMNHLGAEGYRTIASAVMDTTHKIADGIRHLEGLRLLAEPDMSVLAFTSDTGDIHRVGDALARKGWHLDRLQFPDALHLTITQLNVGVEEKFLNDLESVLHEQQERSMKSQPHRQPEKMLSRIMECLPDQMVDPLVRKAGEKMGTENGDRGRSVSALYGFSATMKDRKNMKKMIINLLDGLY